MMDGRANWILTLVLVGSACSRTEQQSVEPGEQPTAAREQALMVQEGSVESKAVLAYVNAPSTTAQRLRDEASMRKAGAAAIVARREGPDGRAETADDQRFTTIDELRAVPSFYDSFLPRLYHAAARAGMLERGVSVVFSPQPLPASNTRHLADMIDRAQASLDVAMFAQSETATGEALKRAASRGVKVRYLLDGARQAVEDHRKVDFYASLEQAGVDIRASSKSCQQG
jgi:phosphatidylserine/phosphatidylglycerophosphate/cardiolipin synthase-like enzyme